MALERSVGIDKFSHTIYLCYFLYAPLYIVGPIISLNAFASQWNLETVITYGSLHYWIWVLNFMWLKIFLIWRYIQFWALVSGIDAPENMPRCINNCYNLESFWKNWHASFNKWSCQVHVHIPLGGSGRKLLNVWVVFTFVAIWHDLECKLLSWAWLTCIFFIPETLLKSTTTSFQICWFSLKEFENDHFALISIWHVANLVGFVIRPSGISWLKFVFLQTEGFYFYFCFRQIIAHIYSGVDKIKCCFLFPGLPTLFGLLVTFYVGKSMRY
uniref:Uncharacterized protein n=1 Tax=Lactuca sativa TaxID=4236 RepID=A0A9R1UUG4_LACSA|nr:hypothetical protein LSAT_V11C800420350 [Lactuca sativa]